MCRFSHVAEVTGSKTRPAQVGHDLVTTKLPSGVPGANYTVFADMGNPDVVVCLACGTTVSISVPPALQKFYHLQPVEEAIVLHHGHRDMLCIRTKTFDINLLEAGITITVLSISAQAEIGQGSPASPAESVHRPRERRLVGVG